MNSELKAKLEKVVELVDRTMSNPDIDIEYCIPEVSTTAEKCDINGEPYILVTYFVSEYSKPTRKIRLNGTYLPYDAEKIADLVTFSIEQFMGDIDSAEIGL